VSLQPSAMPSLVYSFVSRGDTVLAEHAAFSGNFDTVALQCLQNVKNPESKFTITCDGHTFNFLNDQGYSERVAHILRRIHHIA
jgi:vesicle-associated membrane protein 72